jgi:hypothetical protein
MAKMLDRLQQVLAFADTEHKSAPGKIGFFLNLDHHSTTSVII